MNNIYTIHKVIKPNWIQTNNINIDLINDVLDKMFYYEDMSFKVEADDNAQVIRFSEEALIKAPHLMEQHNTLIYPDKDIKRSMYLTIKDMTKNIGVNKSDIVYKAISEWINYITSPFKVSDAPPVWKYNTWCANLYITRENDINHKFIHNGWYQICPISCELSNFNTEVNVVFKIIKFVPVGENHALNV